MVRRSIWIFWPSFISETCSVGITIWRTLRCWPSDTTRCSRFCLTLFSCPEYVLTAYQRNMFFRSRLEDCLDELREDRVQAAQVGTDDQHEEENDPRELGELPAIRPLDALKLRPHRHEEREKPTALVRVAVFSLSLDAARATGGRGGGLVAEGLVVGVEARRRGLFPRGALAEADVLGRRAHLEVDELLDVALLLGVDLAVGGGGVARGVAGRGFATLREALLAALLLPLLRALTVAGHRSTRGRSARLFVTRVLLAPLAVLAHLDPVRIVALGLLCLVVASLALVTGERHSDSHVSPGHVLLGGLLLRERKTPPAARGRG